MKRFTTIVSAFLILALSSAGIGPAHKAAAAPTTGAWVLDWRVNVFQDTPMPSVLPTSIGIVSAKNAIEPFQIIYRSNQASTINNVEFSTFKSGNNSLPASSFRYHFIDYITTGSNSQNVSGPVRTVAPGTTEKFPEIMSNDLSRAVAANTSQPIWIKVKVPAGTPTGTYTGSVTVKSTKGSFPINLSVEVANVTLPDASSPDAYSTELWAQLVGNFDTTANVINDNFGTTTGSAAWWGVMGEFAKLMKENRLNVLKINQLDLLLEAPGTKVAADGTVTFDWSFFDAFIQFFKDNAGIQKIIGGPLSKYKADSAELDSSVPGSNSDYSNTFVETLAYDPANPTGKPLTRLIRYDLEPTPVTSYLTQYLTALNQHLTAKGWKGIFEHHVIDEPGGSFHQALYPVLSHMINTYAPGMKTEEAVVAWSLQGLKSMINTPVIMLNNYQLNAAEIESYRKPGEDLWMYTSLDPVSDNYLNTIIDRPVWHGELFGWLTFKWGMSGYLNWGLNQWNTWINHHGPFPNYPADQMYARVLGDGNFTYPDPAKMTIRSSIRLESLRQASQEHELLRLLKAKDPAAADALVNRIIRSGNDYETDYGLIAAAQKELVRAAAGQDAPLSICEPDRDGKGNKGDNNGKGKSKGKGNGNGNHDHGNGHDHDDDNGSSNCGDDD
ncbi:DUF4091 domain-containing protein [Paenibacillus herberti]|uniref:Uncharacterized protein n=1 Tax=Paenibacillus herberti TaxID=1619309 RepID=A0A229P0F0_9BACL|nr:DUF4091 domain-containing protein [Paenibacillus herberti]OXM15464.1 hypothetical protein CGZ75_01620 [Paenibacillus herberti]